MERCIHAQSLDTLCVQAGSGNGDGQPFATPLVQSTTFCRDGAGSVAAHAYSRVSNPIYYPSPEFSCQASLAARQHRGGHGAVPSFELHGGLEAARSFVQRLRLCRLVEQVGSVETLITHVATLRCDGDEPDAHVHPVPLDRDDVLAGVRAEENAAVIEWDDGQREIVRGRGAGRWPTAEAVLADILEVARARDQGSDHGAETPACAGDEQASHVA